jgi:hypothetical protein
MKPLTTTVVFTNSFVLCTTHTTGILFLRYADLLNFSKTADLPQKDVYFYCYDEQLSSPFEDELEPCGAAVIPLRIERPFA